VGIKEMFRVCKRGGRVVFDVRNMYHITNITDWLVSKLKMRLGLFQGMWKPTAPHTLNNILDRYSSEYSFKGFYVLLPNGLPVLGAFGDIVKYSNWLSYGLQDTGFRSFGAKLIYICDKNS